MSYSLSRKPLSSLSSTYFFLLNGLICLPLLFGLSSPPLPRLNIAPPPVGVPGAEAVPAPKAKGLPAFAEGAPNGLPAAGAGEGAPKPPKVDAAELVVEPNWKGEPPGVVGAGLVEAAPNWNGEAGAWAEGDGAPKGDAPPPEGAPNEGADIV